MGGHGDFQLHTRRANPMNPDKLMQNRHYDASTRCCEAYCTGAPLARVRNENSRCRTETLECTQQSSVPPTSGTQIPKTFKGDISGRGGGWGGGGRDPHHHFGLSRGRGGGGQKRRAPYANEILPILTPRTKSRYHCCGRKKRCSLRSRSVCCAHAVRHP